MSKFFLPKLLFRNFDFETEKYIETDKDGRIKRIGKVRELGSDELNSARHLDGVVIPGFVNSHSHAFQVLLRGRGDHPKNFHDWVKTSLYPLVKSLKTTDIEIATKVAYAQMIRNGITCVGEFHYLHNLHPDETPDINSNDPISISVIKSAEEIGIRQRFLYTGYDLGSKPGQERFNRNPFEVVESLNSLKKLFRDSPLIRIGAAPHSLHGASEVMIRELKKWAEENGEVCHIHLSEQEGDVKESLNQFGMRPVEYLEDKGFLSSSVVIVHGIWLENSEINTLSTRGVKHVYNPMTNMHLGDGIAPIRQYLARGVTTALGTDANVNPDITKEMKAVEYLQRISALEMGIIQSVTSDKNAAQTLFKMGTENGGIALKLKVGLLEEGYFGDFLVLDVDDFGFANGTKKYFLENLTLSASIQNVLKEVYVGGNLVYSKDQGFTRFDQKELYKSFTEISNSL